MKQSRKQTRKQTRRQRRKQTRRERNKKTGKNVPWKGWSKEAPKGKERTIMLKKCGKKCFLGKNKSFPICKKGTCKRSRKGIYAAYVRARQWTRKNPSYKKVAKKAYKLLHKK